MSFRQVTVGALVAVAMLVSLCGCGSKDLSREAAVAMLRDVNGLLVAEKNDEASRYFAVPEGKDPRQLPAMLPGLLAKKEISTRGITVIAENGKWGPIAQLDEVERLRGYIKDFATEESRCFGLQKVEERAEAIFCHGDDGSYRLIRLNNIGKL